jgi:hypothetical protein
MTRYFFDIRDGDEFVPDEEGMELPHVEAAQVEAARSLADIVLNKSNSQPFTLMSIRSGTMTGLWSKPSLYGNYSDEGIDKTHFVPAMRSPTASPHAPRSFK